MIHPDAPKEIREAYDRASSLISIAKKQAQETGEIAEVENLDWFLGFLEKAVHLIGSSGMELFQAKGMMRALTDCEPSTPLEVAQAIDAFASVVMKDAQARADQ
jgi:hypothetical protein